MVILNRGPVKIGVLFFNETMQEQYKIDLLEHYQALENNFTQISTEFYSITLCIENDLNKVFNKLKKDTRNEIRRALNKDLFEVNYLNNPSKSILSLLVSDYSYFGKIKGIGVFSFWRLNQYCINNKIVISSIKDLYGKTIIWHVYFLTNSYVRLLYSFPTEYAIKNNIFRTNLFGRANKMLHWKDIEYFNKIGLKKYDFGGWYHGNSDIQKIKINKFKEEFGGDIVKYYNYKIPKTLIGKLFLTMSNFRNK